jgi:hypothetical protein
VVGHACSPASPSSLGPFGNTSFEATFLPRVTGLIRQFGPLTACRDEDYSHVAIGQRWVENRIIEDPRLRRPRRVPYP